MDWLGRLDVCFAGVLCAFSVAACGKVAGTVPDAPASISDASAVDAAVCFGTGLVHVCLAAAPATSFMTTASGKPMVIDTASSSLCVETVSGGSNDCVIAATTITLGGPLRAAGPRPLVLIASDTIQVAATIDVASHRGATPEIGAGADSQACMTGTEPTTANNASGGGAGGTFMRRGGHGGNGAGASGTAGSAPLPLSLADVTSLRGGCAGQAGAGATRAPGGHGGGAVFLIAGNEIDVDSEINAAGEGGAGGAAGMALGGGGGGSGGMIGFDAPKIVVGSNSLVLATGGGGGEGSTDVNAGLPGSDPTTTQPAAGGSGGNINGGNGGAGSIGDPTASVNDGIPGTSNMDGSHPGGGGGGGGGAGLIKSPVLFQSTLAAPPPVS